MFGTIRKHQQWLWVFLIAVMSVSLVVFFTDYPTRQQFAREEGGEFGSIQGRPITREQALDARKEVMLFFFLNNRRWPTGEDVQDRQMQRETLNRAFLVQKLKDLDLHVSEKAVGRFMADRVGDMPRERVEAEILAPGGLRWDDFDRFARHQVAIQEMLSTAGLGGTLVNPKEAEDLYRAESEASHAEVATFWASNYLSKVTVTPDEIAKYYSNHLAAFRVPERMQVSYVSFPATNFFADADKRMSEITNLDANISDYYFKRGTNQYKDAEGKPLSEAEAKARIKGDMRRELALTSARRAAAEFGNELASQAEPNRLDNFEKLAAAKGLPVLVTPPFDRITGLANTNFPSAFEEDAFNLSTNEPIRFRPVVGENAVYLIAYNKRIPFEIPPLDKVREKVAVDCKLGVATDLARKDGTNFASTAITGLAQGKSFSNLCAQAKAPMITLPPISRVTASLTNVDEPLRLQEVQSVIFNLKPGEASRFNWAREGGWVAYLNSRTPVSDAKLKEELPRFLAYLRQDRYVEAFNKWLMKQAEASQLVSPKEPTNAPPARTPIPASRPPTAKPKTAAPAAKK